MAEGGIPVDSVRGQHDEFFEHTCRRCGARGRNTEASCYCQSCHQFFCTTARDVHDICASYDESNVSKLDPLENPDAMKLGKEEFPPHGGRHIDVLCEERGTLGSTACETLNQRSCDTICVPDLIANDVSNNQDIKFVRSIIKELHGSLLKVKITKEQMKTGLKDSRTNYNKTVADFETKINDLLSNMERNTDDKMEQLYQSRRSVLQYHVYICDTFIQEFADLQAKLADNSMVDSKRFVIMKQGREKILECMDILKSLIQPMKYDIVCSVNKSLLDRLEEIEYLGQLSPNPAPGRSTEITGVKNLRLCNVRTSKDKKTCDIYGVCILVDGTVILSDHSNRNIKRVDERYVTFEVCSMPGYPNGVCCTGKRLVAVALGGKKKVQMVSVTNKMRATEELVFKHSCNGIAYYNNTLYITGGLVRTLYEYKLIEISGKTTCQLIRSFNATHPRSVAVSGDGSFVYLVGMDDKLTIQNRNGDIVQFTKHPHLQKYGENPDVCVDMKGNVILALENAGIIQFKDSGTEPSGILLNQEVTQPTVVFVDHVRSNLIVVQRKHFFSGSDTVAVWDIVY